MGGIHLRQCEEEEDGDADRVQDLHRGDEGEVEEARHEHRLEEADSEGAEEGHHLWDQEGGEERPHPPDLLALHVLGEHGLVPVHLPVLVAVHVPVLVAVRKDPGVFRRHLKRNIHMALAKYTGLEVRVEHMARCSLLESAHQNISPTCDIMNMVVDFPTMTATIMTKKVRT